MIWSAGALRSASGFRVANRVAELIWPPPVKPTTLATAGSERTMPIKSASFWLMAWNEMLWSATIVPLSLPVSCCGKNPLGTIVYR